MKKKFVVVYDDSGHSAYYSVWNRGEKGAFVEYRYAEFYGKGCRRYAYAYCKMLNALPEKDKP